MARAKIHHYVTKVLQKSFCAEDGKIWYSEKVKDGGHFSKPEFRNIDKTFQIRNFYTILHNDAPSDIVEKKFYGSIDDYLGRVLPGILSIFKKRGIPTFDGEPLNSLRRIVFEMIKRTPEFIKEYDDIETGREIVNDVLAEMRNNGAEEEQMFGIARQLEDQSRLKLLGRTARVKAAVRPMQEVQDALKDFSVRWAVSEGKASFVLSSNIAYRIGNGGHNGIANPDMEIWMPISPKIALVLIRDPSGSIPMRVSEPCAHIRKVNEYAVANSLAIASHSELLLKSLVRAP